MKKFEIYNHRQWIEETDPETLVSKLSVLLSNSGYKVLNFVEHHFNPQGYTCIWLLAESHLAVHTFPEDQRSYLELSGCKEEMNSAFVKQLKEWEQSLTQKNEAVNS